MSKQIMLSTLFLSHPSSSKYSQEQINLNFIRKFNMQMFCHTVKIFFGVDVYCFDQRRLLSKFTGITFLCIFMDTPTLLLPNTKMAT